MHSKNVSEKMNVTTAFESLHKLLIKIIKMNSYSVKKCGKCILIKTFTKASILNAEV